MSYPATLLCDFYKISHRAQYPAGTQSVYSTWIPRATRYPDITEVVAFGFQSFIKRYLIDYFDEHFFRRTSWRVAEEYRRVITHTLGDPDPDVSHIVKLHALGYLPLQIKAVPEGTLVPLRVPMLTIENTLPEFAYLTNYIETLFSAECWMPATSATLAHAYRKLLNAYAMETTGSTEGVQFQGHDFSMRGMPSLEAAAASGAGHLLSFVGTDTIPAILYAEKYYGASLETELVGTSIPATEHSVMCAYGRDEMESYRHIINEVYPTGFVSIVSDTWDLWAVLDKVIRGLRDDIMAREGKVVIRPDSGDPVKIICGDLGADDKFERQGVIEILWDIFGGTVNDQGYKVLDPHIGAIYGDAITMNRCEAICEGLKVKGFASTNMVYGIGSYTYQFQTRDTFGFALKATHTTCNGAETFIYKDPVTDDGTKKSLTGKVVVVKGDITGIHAIDGLTTAEEAKWSGNLLQEVFINGHLLHDQKFADVRKQLGHL